MTITDDMIEHLADLARLRFTEQEKGQLKYDLERMIGFVEKLREVNTEGVEPLLYISGAENVLRDDEVIKTISKQEALLNAPHTDGNFFKVPKVIRKNE